MQCIQKHQKNKTRRKSMSQSIGQGSLINLFSSQFYFSNKGSIDCSPMSIDWLLKNFVSSQTEKQHNQLWPRTNRLVSENLHFLKETNNTIQSINMEERPRPIDQSMLSFNKFSLKLPFSNLRNFGSFPTDISTHMLSHIYHGEYHITYIFSMISQVYDAHNHNHNNNMQTYE